MRKTLSSAIIRCHFDCASSSWYSGIGKLQITQNKVVRFILNIDSRASISCESLVCLGMVRVDDRTTQLKLNLVFNIVYGNAPNHLDNKLVLNNNNNSDATCTNENNFIP